MAYQDDFIAAIAPLIVKYSKLYGYQVASPIIAQACVESNYGRSKLSASYFNFFGLKSGSGWKGASVNMSTKEEYTAGTLTTIKDHFRVYASMEEGVKGYFDFIGSYKRYANLKAATTPEAYLQTIKADGYATASTYVNTNMKVVDTYHLRNWDVLHGSLDMSAASDLTAGIPMEKNPAPYPEPGTLIKRGSKGNSVRWLQYMLNRAGYGLVVDGVAGLKTEAAVVHFQWSKGLSIDGICGPATRAALKAG